MNVDAGLARWFSTRAGHDVAIGDFKRHAEGWSWQTYTLSVDGRGYAVRREPEDGLLAPYDVVGQYELHAALEREAPAVPLPRLVALELDPSWLGMPFYVMERVEGSVPVQWDAAFGDDVTRVRIGEQFVDILAAIHAVDPATVPLRAATTADGAALAAIDALEAGYEAAVMREIPMLREGLRWLRANLATSGNLAVTHGDYRVGNFMVRDGRIVAIFDWELASILDPVSDLAWAGLRLFRGRSPRWSHLLEEADFLARYRAQTGVEAAPEVLRFWTIFSHVKAAVPHLRAARVFEDGTFDDLRLACMGHQVLYIVKTLAEDLGL